MGSLMMTTRMIVSLAGTRGERICEEGRASTIRRSMMKTKLSLNRKGGWLGLPLGKNMKRMPMKTNLE
jgi:hypothetical protein